MPPNDEEFPADAIPAKSPASFRITELPEDMRPRERMWSHGPGALSDAELLAVFFGSGQPGLNVVEMAQQLLVRYGGLYGLSKQAPQQIREQRGIGEAKALLLAAVFELGKRVQREHFMNTPLETSKDIYELLGQEMRPLAHESVRLVLVSAKLRLLRVLEIHQGTMDSVSANLRLILRGFLSSEAYAFFLVHNHPSGDPTPSAADLAFTRKLRDACVLMELNFYDHVIIGQPSAERPSGYYSFREGGVM